MGVYAISILSTVLEQVYKNSEKYKWLLEYEKGRDSVQGPETLSNQEMMKRYADLEEGILPESEMELEQAGELFKLTKGRPHEMDERILGAASEYARISYGVAHEHLFDEMFGLIENELLMEYGAKLDKATSNDERQRIADEYMAEREYAEAETREKVSVGLPELYKNDLAQLFGAAQNLNGEDTQQFYDLSQTVLSKMRSNNLANAQILEYDLIKLIGLLSSNEMGIYMEQMFSELQLAGVVSSEHGDLQELFESRNADEIEALLELVFNGYGEYARIADDGKDYTSLYEPMTTGTEPENANNTAGDSTLPSLASPEEAASYISASIPQQGSGTGTVSLYSGTGEDGEGASIDLSGLFTQSLSSEDFNATLVSALTTALNTAFAAEDLWTGVGETFSGGFATLVDAQAETFKSQGLFIGTSMAAGIQEGIENGTADVCNAIRLVASNAVHEAKKRLDINSPSRVFRQIGLSTGEGFALGIDESLLLAENAAMRMAEGVARAGAGTNAGAGRGAVVNLNVNQPSIRSDDDVRRLSEEFARYTAAMTYGL